MTGRTQIKKNSVASPESSLWCWIAIALVIVITGAVRWRFATMPLLRDEGEYAYIAQQMLKGVPPYESAYSMKLPGIYVIYALFLACFGQTITAIHLGLIIFNAATIIVIFLLTRYMFGGLAGIAAGAFYAILSVVSTMLGFMANAEHFVLLPALIGILLIVKHHKNRSFSYVFWTGLLFGLAFIIKQHGIFFAFFGGLYLLFSRIRRRPIEWKKAIKEQIVFITGAIVPYALVCLYYWQAGLFGKFWFWTFTYAREYSSLKLPGGGLEMFVLVGRPILVTLPSVWLLALAGLGAVFARTSNRRFAVFIAGFLFFSSLAVCPGFYFRPHYFILICPAAAILAGLGFVEIDKLISRFVTGPPRNILVAFVGLAVIGVCAYQHKYLFAFSPADVCRLFYPQYLFNESIEIAEYIKKNSSPKDTVAIVGSEPQICFYSGRRSATRYIYTYPLTEPHRYAVSMRKEMMADIENNKPEFLIFVNVSYAWAASDDSAEYLLLWAHSYANRYYKLAGIIDMRKDGTVYRWNEQAVGFNPATNFWIAVFKRK
ncbi:MAG: glycosyltransferase family 39 protein [Sedimentisphaerales bacterium]